MDRRECIRYEEDNLGKVQIQCIVCYKKKQKFIINIQWK